jgi:hypothetical protein
VERGSLESGKPADAPTDAEPASTEPESEAV